MNTRPKNLLFVMLFVIVNAGISSAQDRVGFSATSLLPVELQGSAAAEVPSIPLSLLNAAADKAQAAPKIAFTFDDLPAHGSLPPGETRVGIIDKIITALRNAHVPPTYGFTNGRLLQEQPADSAVLKAWRDAGFPLGNHAWSHMNLNQHTVAEFESDVEKNEAILAERMQGQDWHWLRYPYLSEGDTPEKRNEVRKSLLQRGYKVASVTMSFGDYQWTEPYARCLQKGDQSTVEKLKKSYLDAADKTLAYDRDLSKSLLGRDIPYVLLMHVGAATADMLPKLLELYRSRGFQFVSLDQAEQDEFYRGDTNLGLPSGTVSLESFAKERQVSLPPRPAPPLQFDSLCR